MESFLQDKNLVLSKKSPTPEIPIFVLDHKPTQPTKQGIATNSPYSADFSSRIVVYTFYYYRHFYLSFSIPMYTIYYTLNPKNPPLARLRYYFRLT